MGLGFKDGRRSELENETERDSSRPSRSPIKPEPTEGASLWQRESRRSSTHVHNSALLHDTNSPSHTPILKSSLTGSPAPKMEEELVGGDVEIIQEPGETPKLSRTMSKKILSRPPPLFSDWPDATSEAQRSYEVIRSCSYANKYLGTTDHAMDCECNEEWDATTKQNYACGEDSDCINRATKMECIGDCCCGSDCQNQRFQRRQYASVSVIRTEKKGYGLRADVDLPAHTSIFEYIGEVIGEAVFRRRMVDYDKEGIKHFYFMSLNKGEFVDATKRGNLGRFCNHSCNPNCYVDKWVVGEKLRMGIFTERNIRAGEELVFNYNVDRYGANPQPCYCGEPNCTGYIGGKTQTERATKLSTATIEALGIEDGDGWDLAVAKKGRKKKAGEDDEEYVDRVQPKSLDEDGVVKVMATLMQCKEKWIAVKLLSRIQECSEERVRNRVVKMHGYQILKSQLSTWMEDANIIRQILYILHRLPRITRNKIQDSGIEAVVSKLVDHEDAAVQEEASSLLKIWSALEIGYRIPRVKRDPGAVPPVEKDKPRRRSRSRSKSRSRSASPNIPKGPSAPTGPRAGFAPPGRGGFFPPRAPFRRPPFSGPPPNAALPPGWFQTPDPAGSGKIYYYSVTGETTWLRPSKPAIQPPPPPKVTTKEQALDDIIKGITTAPKEKEKEKVTTPNDTSRPDHKPYSNHDRHKREEKWRKLPIEKQMKLYEVTLSTVITPVVDKYRHKLDKEDLKRFAKELNKQMVKSDYKHKKVTDPTALTPKKRQGVKEHCKMYFDKACVKKKERDRRKAAERVEKAASADAKTFASKTNESSTNQTEAEAVPSVVEDDDDEVILSDMEEDPADESPSTQSGQGDADLKRKREAENTPLTAASDEDPGTPLKKARSDIEMGHAPPPPPPPPPPDADMPQADDGDVETPTGINGLTMQDRDQQAYGEAGMDVGPRRHASKQTNGMHVDEADDDDYLVGHWGLADEPSARLPVRQGS